MPVAPSFNELMAFIKNMPKEQDDKMRICHASPEFKALSEKEKEQARLAFLIAAYAEAQQMNHR